MTETAKPRTNTYLLIALACLLIPYAGFKIYEWRATPDFDLPDAALLIASLPQEGQIPISSVLDVDEGLLCIAGPDAVAWDDVGVQRYYQDVLIRSVGTRDGEIVLLWTNFVSEAARTYPMAQIAPMTQGAVAASGDDLTASGCAPVATGEILVDRSDDAVRIALIASP